MEVAKNVIAHEGFGGLYKVGLFSDQCTSASMLDGNVCVICRLNYCDVDSRGMILQACKVGNSS